MTPWWPSDENGDPDPDPAERLPEDAPVVVASIRMGYVGVTHLFADCNKIAEDTHTEIVPLSDPRADRSDLCGHCTGENYPAGGENSGPYETLEDMTTGDLEERLEREREDLEGDLATDGGSPTGVSIDAHDVEDPRDHPKAVDPDDPRVDEVYVAHGRSSGRVYHLDPDCKRLAGDVSPRRAEIGASWHPPCRFCVTEEFPAGSDDYVRDDSGGEA